MLGNNKRSSTQQKAIFLFSFHTELYSWPVQFLRAAAFKFRGKKERERGTEESAAIVPIVEWIQTFDIFPDGPLLFFSTGHKKLCCYLCHCVAETGGLCGPPSTPPFGHFQNKWRIILASHSLTLGLSPTDLITFPSQQKKNGSKKLIELILIQFNGMSRNDVTRVRDEDPSVFSTFIKISIRKMDLGQC